MEHEHGVYDKDKHFKIDPITRQIENATGKVVLIQHDHDSERFTFEIPKTVEGHDMSNCNAVQIHYLNIEATTKTDTEGLYEVDDLKDSNIINQQGENEDVVVFSWLISRNATQYVGSLNFVVRFKCVEDDGTVTYEWSTAIHKGITISESIYNSEVVVAEYADVLEKWRASLFFNTDGVTEDVAMGGHKITGMGSPTNDADAATKGYVDDALKNIDLSGVDASDKVSKAGDIMAGQLDMNGNKIIGIGTPTDDADAANKAYVDNKVGSIDVRQQLNALSAELPTKLGFVELYKNASYGSSFAGQAIAIPTLSNYLVFAIVTSQGTFFLSTTITGEQPITCTSLDTDERSIKIHMRKITVGENVLNYGANYKENLQDTNGYDTENQHYLKPYGIYGVY